MSMFSTISASSTSRPRGGRLERIEVHADEVDLLDVVLGERGDVLGVAAHGEQPGVQARVQRLHAPVHDLREAREVLDRADLEARVGERLGGAAGRDELDAEVGEAARELDDAALVGDRQQRALDLHRARRGERLGGFAVGCVGDGASISPADAPSRPRAGARARRRSRRSAGVAAGPPAVVSRGARSSRRCPCDP